VVSSGVDVDVGGPEVGDESVAVTSVVTSGGGSPHATTRPSASESSSFRIGRHHSRNGPVAGVAFRRAGSIVSRVFALGNALGDELGVAQVPMIVTGTSSTLFV
jgi:hypothetical protein